MTEPDWPWRILLVEDNIIDQSMVRRSLKQNGTECELRIIADGEEALNYISQLDRNEKIPVPHIALLDIQLPYHDGLELLKTLRASERCGQIPVIIMTGSASAETLFKSAKRNAPSHTFEKKADFESYLKLGAMIEEVLQKNMKPARKKS
jgi:two-component system, response regulator